jgi:DNA-binding NarL/FixJ family response regulator
MSEALEQLEPDDRPVVGMLLDGAADAEIAEVLRVEPADIEHATRRILARLSATVQIASG